MNSSHSTFFLKFIAILILYILLQIPVFSQEQKQPETLFMKSKDGVVYIDNTQGSYFSIDIPGDSLNGGNESFFLVDNQIYQVMNNPYDGEMYNNSMDTTKAIELLKHGMKYETDYISNEIFKTDIKADFTIFKNTNGKRFLLWYYETPEINQDSTPDLEMSIKHHCYLTFIANQRLVGLYRPLDEGVELEKGISDLKEIADRIDIYGFKVNLDGLHFKLRMQAEDADFVYVDSVRGYQFEIPEWLNLLDNNSEDVWIATLPGINNVKNAIMVQRFDKKEYKSFKAFNNEKLVKLKMGDQIGNIMFMLKNELETPENLNGVAYKVNQSFNNVLYHAQYLTIKTSNSYLLIVFTATPETYNVNLPKFEEFVSGIKILD